jgi:hypothetical protein
MHRNSILLDDIDQVYQYGSRRYIPRIRVLIIENAANTVLHGEQSFKEGSDAISEAIKTYDREVTHHLLTGIHEGTGCTAVFC